SVMLWIAEAIPSDNRWHAVFQRYLQEIGGRVTVFGGDPGQISPSPTGDGRKPPGPAPADEASFTGKISALVFDHFGDFAASCSKPSAANTSFTAAKKRWKSWRSAPGGSGSVSRCVPIAMSFTGRRGSSCTS